MQAYRVHRLHTRRRGPVPRLALVGEILHILQQAALFGAGQVGVTGVVAGVRVLVEVRQRVAPGLPVLGHVVIVPTVGFAGRQRASISGSTGTLGSPS